MNAPSDDAVERFAAEATRFRDWTRNGSDTGDTAVRSALLRITTLYAVALELPQPWSVDLGDQPDAIGITADERRKASEAATRLPFSAYASVFEPSVIPPEEPVIGCIGDDIGDIYGDVVGGLHEYQSGRRAQAIWEWSYLLRIHWGRHATNAIVALHSWLAENSPDQLSSTA